MKSKRLLPKLLTASILVAGSTSFTATHRASSRCKTTSHHVSTSVDGNHDDDSDLLLPTPLAAAATTGTTTDTADKGFIPLPERDGKISRPSSFSSSTQLPKSPSLSSPKGRVAVLICPAQFCVPADYQDLVQALNEQYGHTVAAAAVAPLPRTEWIKVAKQLPTKEFVQAQLSVFGTLKWYFDAMDLGISNLLLQAAEMSDSNVAAAADKDPPPLRLCIVGHSIGGWVARAYLGGMSRSSTAAHNWALRSCTSLITLGTPHASSPPDGASAWVDQTRGLLRQIDETESCRSSALAERGIDVTCVCSDSLRAGTSSVEEAVALASYLPLLGRYDPNVRGDGIVPLDLAFLDAPARKVVVKGCSVTSNAVRHSHVVPTPWNLWDGYAPSIALPDEFCSYTSPGVLSQWAKYIR